MKFAAWYALIVGVVMIGGGPVANDGSLVQTLHHIGKVGSPKLAVGGGYAFWSGGGVSGSYRLRLPAD